MKRREMALGDLVDNFDNQRVPIATSKRQPGPFPYYGASGVVDHVREFLFEGLHLLVSEDGENLRTRTTPIAFLADGQFWVNNLAHVLRGKYGIADTKYLSYVMATTDVSPYLSGSAQPKLSQTALNSIRLLVPPIREQQAIAEVLGALDDKIAANSATLATIAKLAKATYRQHATQRSRLTDLAIFVNGRNFTKDASGHGRPVIRIAELNSGLGGSTVYNDVDANADNTAEPGDILFAWSGSLTLKRWVLQEGIVNQHIFKVTPTNDLPAWLVFQALQTQMPSFRAIAANKATTMGHIQRRHLEVEVPVPSTRGAERIGALMQSLWEQEFSLERESQTLSQLRDTLLPALMDGSLRVKDAVRHAEAAL